MEFLTRDGTEEEKVNGVSPQLSPRINGELQVNQRSSADLEIAQAGSPRYELASQCESFGECCCVVYIEN